MAVRKFKPTTPGQRHKIIGTFEEITASVPEKSLVFGKRSTGGRNNVGKMTMRYICLLYTSPSPRDVEESRMPSSA